MKKFLITILATILLALCFFAYAAAESKIAAPVPAVPAEEEFPCIVSFHQFD